MSDTSKQLLEQINEISRQLLSRITEVQNKSQDNSANIKEADGDDSLNDISLVEQELTGFMSKRQGLIHCLFEQNEKDEIAKELTLINEMVALDSELSVKSQACKNIIAEQVIRLKKSKKVKTSYQKY